MSYNTFSRARRDTSVLPSFSSCLTINRIFQYGFSNFLPFLKYDSNICLYMKAEMSRKIITN